MHARAASLDDPTPNATNERPSLEKQTCRTQLWRGYRSASYYAIAGDGSFVAESSSFRCRGKGTPSAEGPGKASYAELLEKLEQLGWRRADDAEESWDAATYLRYVEAVSTPNEPTREEAPTPPAVLPEPAPAPRAPTPAAAQTPANEPTVAPAAVLTGPTRHRLAATVLAIVAVALVGAATYGLVSFRAARTTHVVYITTPAGSVPAAKHVPAPRVRLGISTKGRASWLEVRRGSKSGAVLYSGELPPGRHLQFVAPRIWARFGAAGNIAVTRDGRPIALNGTLDRVFVAPR